MEAGEERYQSYNDPDRFGVERICKVIDQVVPGCSGHRTIVDSVIPDAVLTVVLRSCTFGSEVPMQTPGVPAVRLGSVSVWDELEQASMAQSADLSD